MGKSSRLAHRLFSKCLKPCSHLIIRELAALGQFQYPHCLGHSSVPLIHTDLLPKLFLLQAVVRPVIFHMGRAAVFLALCLLAVSAYLPAGSVCFAGCDVVAVDSIVARVQQKVSFSFMNLSTKNWRLKKNSKLFLSKQSHSQTQYLTFTNSSVKKAAARWIGFQQAAAALKTRMEAARIHHSLTQLTVFSWSVQRKKTTCFTSRFLAAGEGFEPSQTESESVVLPLHNPAISLFCLAVCFPAARTGVIIPNFRRLSIGFLKYFSLRLISSFFHPFILFPHFIASLFCGYHL